MLWHPLSLTLCSRVSLLAPSMFCTFGSLEPTVHLFHWSGYCLSTAKSLPVLMFVHLVCCVYYCMRSISIIIASIAMPGAQNDSNLFVCVADFVIHVIPLQWAIQLTDCTSVLILHTSCSRLYMDIACYIFALCVCILCCVHCCAVYL